MKSHSFKNLAGRTSTITLKEGDIFGINEDQKIQIEIGPNDTFRAVVGGTPSPKGWQQIPGDPKVIKDLCNKKKHFCVKTTGDIIEESE